MWVSYVYNNPVSDITGSDYLGAVELAWGTPPLSALGVAAVERVREWYAESLTEQLHILSVGSVGLVGLVPLFTRLISCPRSLFLRSEASHVSTVD